MADFGLGVQVIPLNGRVLVEVFGEQISSGGIYIPDASYSKFQLGVVAEISSGKAEAGYLYEHNVRVGDTVIFHSSSGYPVDIDDKKYKLMPESEIMAIIKGGSFG